MRDFNPAYLARWVNNGGKKGLRIGLLHLSDPTLMVRIGAAGSCQEETLLPTLIRQPGAVLITNPRVSYRVSCWSCALRKYSQRPRLVVEW